MYIHPPDRLKWAIQFFSCQETLKLVFSEIWLLDRNHKPSQSNRVDFAGVKYQVWVYNINGKYVATLLGLQS